MKKLIIIALFLMACAASAKADCYLTSYSITQNWAQGTCVGSRGQVYDLRESFFDWVLDYGL